MAVVSEEQSALRIAGCGVVDIIVMEVVRLNGEQDV
jgi:hypothetical protein